MKQVYSLLLFMVCSCLCFSAFAQPGVIDQSFGSNGKVRMPITIGDRVHPVDLKLQPDNKILVLVTSDTGYSGYDVENFFKYQLFRFNPDGTPDNTFGTNGNTPVVDRERPTGMELLANGQIILNTARFDGRSLTWPYYDSINLCLTRYNANGTIDNTFGTNGRTVSPIGNTQTIANGLIVLPNGKMIQSGISYVSSFVSTTAPTYSFLLGFDQNGNKDASFGTNGMVKVRIIRGFTVDYTYAWAVEFNHHVTCLMQSNQRLVVPADSGMYRFNSNGTLDHTFGTNGYAMYPPGYTWGAAPHTPWKFTQSPVFAGLVEPNDKIMLVKHTTPDSTISYSQTPIMACRFNANGSPDTTFPNFVINPDNGMGFTHGRNSGSPQYFGD